MKSIENLRGAIVGFGSIGHRHYQNLVALGTPPPVVVRRPEQRNAVFVPPTGTQVVTSDAEAIAAGIDFAIICNPTRFHADTACRYIAAGIPVLVEKPISDRCEDASQLVEDGIRYGTPGCMAYCMRYHPAYSSARQALLAGAIGRVLYAKAWFESYLPLWHPWEDYAQSYAVRKDLGGGALRTLDHEIDFLNWCLGIPETVTGCSRRSGALHGDADDTAALMLGYPAGVTATLNLSFCRRDRSRGFEFVGERGTLRYRWEEERLLAVAVDGSVSLLLDHRGYDVNQMYIDLLADFLGIVAGGRGNVAADLQAGIDTIQVCCQVESNGSVRGANT